MPDINWNNPCPHWRVAPDRVLNLEKSLRDYQARHETSLEVIRAREVEVDRLRARIAELEALCDSALAIIADAIVHGMPVTQRVADVRNQIAKITKGT
jgi:hypothetical protein